ncbi:hypothetical protein TIFTF001_040356 [Ficus carica]|uniref:Uncharacterized protein n=1 Tax=Ficus carica TaxID=3494 RepID=A0AA88CZW4_FICCA|nr:hypothetical protein TIFTF001_040356 [Ficus carica]
MTKNPTTSFDWIVQSPAVWKADRIVQSPVVWKEDQLEILAAAERYCS